MNQATVTYEQLMERFVRWAQTQPDIRAREAFAHYNEEDIWRALWVTMKMFRWLATETAERLGYPYPTAADEQVTEWVRRQSPCPLNPS